MDWDYFLEEILDTFLVHPCRFCTLTSERDGEYYFKICETCEREMGDPPRADYSALYGHGFRGTVYDSTLTVDHFPAAYDASTVAGSVSSSQESLADPDLGSVSSSQESLADPDLGSVSSSRESLIDLDGPPMSSSPETPPETQWDSYEEYYLHYYMINTPHEE